MRRGWIWLTLRLMRKQKLRTLTIFCGIFFSGFLLSAFGSLGYYFWEQVQDGASETASFDATKGVLAALAAVLLALVVLCSVILLNNLFSLTFLQKWHTLKRLTDLGATEKQLIFLVLMELWMIYCVAAPLGLIVTFLLERIISVKARMPWWMIVGILAGLLVLSFVCEMKTVWSGMRKTNCPPKNKNRKKRNRAVSKNSTTESEFRGFLSASVRGLNQYFFSFFMARKYYLSNRGHYIRIILTFFVAIVLYVPVSYLIDTNLSVQQAELYRKYGIQYSTKPKDYEELETSLEKCQSLTEENREGDSLIYVQIPGRAAIKTEYLSKELYTILKNDGWREEELWEADSDIYFVDDPHYKEYLDKYGGSEEREPLPAILVNRYIKRGSYSEKEDPIFPETNLLNRTVWEEAGKAAVEEIATGKAWEEENSTGKAVAGENSTGKAWEGESSTGKAVAGENSIGKAITYFGTMITHGFWGSEESVEPDIYPEVLADEMPEGMDFTGNVSVILPLSQIGTISENDFALMEVYGCFEDNDEALYESLQKMCDENETGQLRYLRRIFQEWYDSMKEIHLAMTAICGILFFIALLNVFCTMVFQYRERKRGLAVLWSLGQTEKGLLRILILENIRSFVISVFIGIPVTCILCYDIYRIFRYVWRIEFTLPWEQICLILAAAVLSSAAAIGIDWCFLKKQDFLQDVKDIT